VAIYSDGVYYARNAGALIDFADTERVEVLRGPQGTLFGRNASAGAIQIISRAPPVDEKDFYGELGYGTENQINAKFSFGTPVVEGVSGFRISASTRNNDGFSEGLNTVTGETLTGFYKDDLISAAAAYLHQWEKTSLRIRGEYMKDESLQSGPASLLPGDPFGRVPPEVFTDPYFFMTNFSKERLQGKVKASTISATIEHEFSNSVLTSITAYRESSTNGEADGDTLGMVDFFESAGDTDQSQFSQELYITGSNDSFEWVVGGFYFDEQNDVTTIVLVFPGFPPGPGIFDQSTKSLAVYGHMTYLVQRSTYGYPPSSPTVSIFQVVCAIPMTRRHSRPCIRARGTRPLTMYSKMNSPVGISQ